MIFGMAGELGGVSKLQFIYRGIFGEILPSHVPCKRNIFWLIKFNLFLIPTEMFLGYYKTILNHLLF